MLESRVDFIMSAGALVIKNAILALLVILIIHFAIKNMLFEKQLDHLRVKEEMTLNDGIIIPSTISSITSKIIPLPANPAPVVQCDEGKVKSESDLESLYKYVFAGNTANEKATKTELSTKPSKAVECEATTSNTTNSNSMFAAYDNKELVFSAW